MSSTEPKRYFGAPLYSWVVVGMLWWISVFNYADRQALSAVFPLLANPETGLGLSLEELGLVGSAFAWVYGICAPFAGLLVDRIRRKTAILGGLQAWSLICMATALAGNFRQLYVFRALEGLGETFYYPASNSLISDYHGKATRSRALGLHQTGVYFGTIAGSYFAGLIGIRYGWRWSFVVFGGLGCLLGLVLHFFLREPRRGAAEVEADMVTSPDLPISKVLPLIVRNPVVPLLMLAFVCANFVAMVLLTWMPSYLNQRFELRLDYAGLGATLPVQTASMISCPLGGWLADRLRLRTVRGRIWVQALGVLGGAPFVLLCGQTQSLIWLCVALSGWGLFKGIYDANIFAALFDVVPPQARGTMAGLMNMSGWLLGASPAPWLVGILATKYGLGPAIGSVAFVYLAAFVILLIAAQFLSRRDLRSHQVGL